MNAPVLAPPTGTFTLTEDSTLGIHTLTGSIAFTDIDDSPGDGNFQGLGAIQPLNTPPYGTPRGSLSALLTDQAEGFGDNSGTVSWTYTIANSLIEDLAQGETRIERFTVTVVDEDGNLGTRTVEITITGNNDAPVFSTGNYNSPVFFEDDTLFDTGILAFNDVDILDVHNEAKSVVVGGDSSGLALDTSELEALLTLSVNSADDDPSGSIDWTFSASSADFEFLDDGDLLTLTYTVTVSDANSGSDSRTITINIEGTNDAPVLSVGSGTVNDTADDDIFPDLTDTFSANDKDDGDPLNFDISGGDPSSEPGGFDVEFTGSYGTLYLDSATGNYKYVADDALVEGLKTIATDTFTIIADDGADSDSELFTVTINGVNDTPELSATVTSATYNDTSGDDTFANVTGSLSSTDRDASETATYGISGGESGSYVVGTNTYDRRLINTHGTLYLDSATGAYEFAPNDAAIEALKTTAIATFTLTVTDASSAVDSETLTITINGVNDISVIAGNATGDVTEEGPLSDSDALAIADRDTGDASFQPITAGTPGANGYGTFEVLANGTWTYSLNNSHASVQALDELETLTDTITVSSSDGSATQLITVTITGTNDIPTVAPGGSTTGALSEPVGTGNYNLNNANLSGSFTVNDLDATDTLNATLLSSSLVWSATNAAPATGVLSATAQANILNSFSFTQSGANPAAINWVFDRSTNVNVNLNFLAATETLTATFVVRTTDDSGTWVDQPVVITFTGTNDTPTANQTRELYLNEGGGNARFTDPVVGTEVDNDPDTGDFDNGFASGTHTVVVGATDITDNQAQRISYNDPDDYNTAHTLDPVTVTRTTTGGSNGLPSEADVLSWFVPSLLQRSVGGTGQINWTFTAPDSAFNYLGDGDTLTLVYQLNVRDSSGAVTAGPGRTVTVTVTGTNDGPVIGATNLSGEVAEGNLTPATLTDSGTIAFSDVDHTDVHTATAVFQSSTYGGGQLGSMTTTVTPTVDGVGGVATWNFSLNDSAVQFLANSETIVETYEITIDDGNGGTQVRTVNVTITGTNDQPAITAVNIIGDVTEDVSLVVDNPNTGAVETGAFLTDTGSVNFTELDESDMVTASSSFLSAVAGNGALSVTPGLLGALQDLTDTFKITQTGTNDGSVDWSFALDNGLAQYLNDGETITVTYRITVTDDSGTGNDSDFEDVTITITGTNDGPVANGDLNTVAEGATLSVGEASGVLANDTDDDATHELTVDEVDGDSGNVGEEIAGSNGGIFIINADGSYSFDPGLDFETLGFGDSLMTSIDYTVIDDNGDSDTATLSVTVTGTNDAPEITPIVVTGSKTESTDTGSSATISPVITGSFSYTDIDASDTHTAEVTGFSFTLPGGTAAQITALNALQSDFNLTVVPSGMGDGTVNWSFDPTDGALDFLRGGQTATLSFTVTLDDNEDSTGGVVGTDTQVITITLTGTNDVVTAGPAADDDDGDVTEPAGSPPAGDPVIVTGTVDFRDADLTGNTAIITRTGGDMPAGHLGTLTRVIGTPDGTGLRTLTWTYTNTHANLEFLGDGDSVTEIFNIEILDQQVPGATLNFPVTITIHGTNDAPVISAVMPSAPMAVAEDMGDSSTQDLDPISGTITVTDPDTYTADMLAAGVTGDAVVLLNGDTFALPMGAAHLDDAGTIVFDPPVAATGAAQDINWTYNPGPADLDFLGLGDTLTLTYTVNVYDGTDNGTPGQTITITITGTNDAPVLSAEIGDSDSESLAETNDGLSVNGTLTVTDLDLTDTVTASVTDVSLSGVTGGLTAGDVGFLSIDAHTDLTPAGLDNGQLTWRFNSGTQAFDFLADGEDLILTYTITATDDNGVTDTHDVVITITGSNDTPVINAGVVTGAMTEDETTPNLTDTGSISFDDVDASDLASVTWSLFSTATSSGEGIPPAVVTALGGALVLTGDTGPANSGTVTWTFTLANALAQYLSDGETLTATYRIYVTDDSGTPNNEAFEDVIITITGANDAPTIVSTAGGVTGGDTEVASGPQNLSESGSFTADDVDQDDVLDAEVDGDATVVWSGGTLAGPDLATANALKAAANLTLTGNFDSVTNELTIDWDYAFAGADLNFLDGDETLTLTYNVTVDDSETGTVSQPITITLQGAEDTAVVTVTNPATTTESDTFSTVSFTIDGQVSISDADRNDVADDYVDGTGVLTATSGPTPATGALEDLVDFDATTGTVQYNRADFNWLDSDESVTYTIDFDSKSGDDLAQPQTLTFTISGQNDAPSAATDTGTLAENVGGTFDVLANDTDADKNESKTITTISLGPVTGLGTLTGDELADIANDFTISGNQIVFAPSAGLPTSVAEAVYDRLNPGQTATIVVNYTMQDDSGSASSSTLTLTINGAAENFTGTVNDDNPFNGSNNDDVMTGLAGDDVMSGLGGGDVMDGGDDNDTLNGGGGADRLIGGQGDDTIVGGSGSDTAVFEGDWADYAITEGPPGTYNLTRGGETDMVSQVEFFEFDNVTATAAQLLNDAPVANADVTVSAAEDIADTVVLATAGASDDDSSLGDTLSYAITGGNGGGLFEINATTGEISLASDQSLDRETAGQHVLTVTVSDVHGASDTQAITINVDDVNEFGVTAPSDNDPAADAVSENVVIGTSVGIDVSAIDGDATNNTVTYSLTSNPGGLFQINASTGVVTTAAAINRELVGASVLIGIMALSSDGSSASASFTVDILDVDEFDVSPVADDDPALNQVIENAIAGTTVGIDVSASDADATTNAVTYSLTNSAGGRFAIDAMTGLVTVAGALDFETATSHVITVQALSADGSVSSQSFTVNVLDEAPVINDPNGNLDGIVNGTAENDQINGLGGDDQLNGLAGNDTIDGGTGGDAMAGGTGNDTYFVDNVLDTITELFNEGSDTVNTTLNAYTLGANVERVNFTGVGNFVGTGTAINNRFQGGAGDDRFVDVLGGSDIFSGNAGSDIVDFRTSATGAVINISTGVHGGAAAGDSYSGIERFWGSNTAGDTMTGDGAKNNLYGFGGSDTLFGGGQSDRLEGGAGSDTLDGQADKDVINGGAGNDMLTGGAAADSFEFSSSAFGQDTVTDFVDNVDKLKIFTGFADDIGDFSISGNGTASVLITLLSSPTNTITLNGAAPITITAADFIFY